MDEKFPVELNYEELRVLNLAMDHIIKHSDVADRLYAGDKKDISLIKSVAGQVRAIYQKAKVVQADQAVFDKAFEGE